MAMMIHQQPLKPEASSLTLIPPPVPYSTSRAAAGSISAKMGHKMELVHHRLITFPDRGSTSSNISGKRGFDDDDDDDDDVFEPMDDELAIVVGEQSLADGSDDPDDVDEVVDCAPLRMVKPGRAESEQEKLPDVKHTCTAHNIITFKRKRRMPTGLRPSKSKMVQKPVLTGSASGSSANSGNEKDDDFVPMVSDVNGQIKCASVQDRCGSTWARALEVQGKLPGEDPSFIKRMLKSHVVRGFWLGLPSKFCKEHLPNHDVVIALEDEDGDSYNAKYLSYKQGLSGGWKDFAVKHDIKVGDVVVFQLAKSTRFKVYILRENKFTTTDGALGLLCLDTSTEKKPKEEMSEDDAKSKEDPEVTRVSDIVDDDSNNLASEEAVDNTIKHSDSYIDFNNVRSFSNFSISFGSLVIDREFPDHLRKTYYELCCARKSFLHKHLLKQINLQLAVGVIMETTNIAEGIRAGNSSHEDFAVWKKTLKSFELLGMDVTFLLKRVDDLLGVLSTQTQPRNPEYEEMKCRRNLAAEKIKALESKMSSVKDALKEMEAEMDEMETSEKKSAQEMWRMATAPW